MNSFGRDPAKRKVKPVEAAQSLLDFDSGESSDDSDFRIEDHAAEESDDYSIDSDNSKGKNNKQSDDSSADSTDCEFERTVANEANSLDDPTANLTINDLLERAKKQSDSFQLPANFANILICAGCLGSRSDDSNEIVECDGCGVTVHEGCYGVSDTTSESSTCSSASTEPWFCEACKAGVTSPTCELCPNSGGIFKETEVRSWVHLVCALYVPGVAFSEVERLSGVTLFEMAYSRWGARACALCADARLARTGVTVSCDAGMCKTYFHVTCGQREGLLAEAHCEEVEQADPFYAHCRLHSDKTLIKKRKRNWLALQIRTQQRKIELENNSDSVAQLRIQRKLTKYRKKFLEQKQTKLNTNPTWVPTQKMPRSLSSSATAVRRLALKAQLMGIDTEAQHWQEVQLATLKDVNRKWHISPAFSVEFIGYYLDRNNRMLNMRRSLQKFVDDNTILVNQQKELKEEYDKALLETEEATKSMETVKKTVTNLHSAISAICPNKTLPSILADCELMNALPNATSTSNHKSRSTVPTAAALKMGVGFPLINNPEYQQGKVLSTSRQAARETNNVESGSLGARCGTCQGSGDPHLLIKCDTCHLHYHLACLKPPLTRPPKKSKLYIWQCSECDKSSDSETEEVKVPRKRTRYCKDGTIVPVTASGKRSPVAAAPPNEESPSSKSGKATTEASPDMKSLKVMTNVKAPPLEIHSPLKVTIKPLEPPKEAESVSEPDPLKLSKKDRKLKKLLQKNQEYSNATGEESTSSKKSRKRSFTSPTLTNTPLMSITPIVVDSPDRSPGHISQVSPNPSTLAISRMNSENTFLSPDSSFSTLLTTPNISQTTSLESGAGVTIPNPGEEVQSHKSNRKRRKEKHRSRYSPDLLQTPSKTHKRKRKKKNQDMENPNIPHPRITIKIKTIPKPAGSVDPQLFYVPTDSNDGPPPSFITKRFSQSTEELSPTHTTDPISIEEPVLPTLETPPTPAPPAPIKEKTQRSPRVSDRKSNSASTPGTPTSALTQCDVCIQEGNHTNLVRCDECMKRYHFTCLEPPLNKNPKKRGYSWHCADCDPTEPEST